MPPLDMVPIEERTVLAADLLEDDLLITSALGGWWEARVTSVRVDPDLVRVRLEGERPVYLCRHEVCTVWRPAR